MYDMGGGMMNAKGFRKGLESFGLQFTEEQVATVFGCYDAKRSGLVHYPTWAEKVTTSQTIAAKKFRAMMAWGDRERMWEKLERKHERREQNEREDLRRHRRSGI